MRDMRVSIFLCSFTIMICLVLGIPQMGGQGWNQRERRTQMSNGLGLNLGLGLGRSSSDSEMVREGGMNGNSASSYSTTGFSKRRYVVGCNGRRGPPGPPGPPPQTTTTTAATTTTTASS
ncbi:uncharacterized protein LOC108912162 [Anoplophora glabripennis]|uniref:uncharacterized protein LOC108912162 n=1 Tax=Anoplophora glabripennis TaxID=217634 RepID=UPI00087439D4|nr:uncharacterized protein LOC108912162 [Anoplophora glabripennis]